MAVILLDALADALCIAMTMRIAEKRICPLRMVCAAAMSAILACIVRWMAFSRGRTAACALPLAALAMWLASGRFRLRAALLLLACEGFLGGTVYALSQALGSKAAAWSVGAVFALIMSSGAVRTRRAAVDVHRVRIRILYADREAEFDAMVDSGNCLRDYLTHRPVIVLPEAAKVYLGLADVPLRPIFADTAGGRQMMDCMTPKGVWVTENGRTRAVSACTAFSPGLPEGSPALVPLSMLAENRDESRDNREGNAYGEAEGAAARRLGEDGHAAGAVHYPAGRNGSVYRRERRIACAADEGRGNGTLCAHGGRAECSPQNAH